MKPSVGRIVHIQGKVYVGLAVMQPVCLAGIVAGVNDDSTINVFCIGEKGRETHALVDVKQGDELGFWHWPERVD